MISGRRIKGKEVDGCAAYVYLDTGNAKGTEDAEGAKKEINI